MCLDGDTRDNDEEGVLLRWGGAGELLYASEESRPTDVTPNGAAEINKPFRVHRRNGAK